jgi:uncharacterized iron-regulated membrane protein
VPTTPKKSSTYQVPPIVGRIRTSRKWHHKLSVVMAILLLISAITGLLLGWKKQVDWLQPGTQRGEAGELVDWKPISELSEAAVIAFRQNAGPDANAEVDRMDVRPSKNVVKVRFEYEDYEVQVDGITGKVLNVGNRNADWIERIHDGSIVSDLFKLISMNLLSFGVFIMTITGLWLYFGPKRYRAQRRRDA